MTNFCNRLVEYEGYLISRCSLIPILAEQSPLINMIYYGVFTLLFSLLSYWSFRTAYLMNRRKRKEFDEKNKRMFILLILFGVLLWYPIYISLDNFIYFLFVI